MISLMLVRVKPIFFLYFCTFSALFASIRFLAIFYLAGSWVGCWSLSRRPLAGGRLHPGRLPGSTLGQHLKDKHPFTLTHLRTTGVSQFILGNAGECQTQTDTGSTFRICKERPWSPGDSNRHQRGLFPSSADLRDVTQVPYHWHFFVEYCNSEGLNSSLMIEWPG